MLITILYIIACAVSFALASIYFIHMFQLNGYHKKAHLKWFCDTLGSSAAKLTPAFIAFVLACIPNEKCRIAVIVLSVISAFFLLPDTNAKKPIVFTARVKRLIFTEIVVFSAFTVVACLYTPVGFLPSLAVIIANFIVLVCDIINSPFEKAVKNHFIKDAKRILASRKNLTIIGITGSYGKTSCKNYLSKLLSPKYNVLITPASYNTPMGVVKTVREHLKNSHEIFICEMGAKNVGDIKELCDIVHPHMGLITSVGPQHLESFKSIDNVIKTKFELYDAVPKDSKVYLNYDNEYIKSVNVSNNAVSFGSQNSGATCIAKNITLSAKGTDFDIEYNGRNIHFSTKLLGSHNVQNLAGCIAIALDLGVDEKDVVLAVKRLETVQHRLQIIDGGNITIIDDAFNANPSGTKAALQVLECFDGLKIIVTPGMIELGQKQKELNEEFGKNCTEVCDYILLVGSRIADEVYKGVMKTDFDKEKLLRFDKVQDAVAYARGIESDRKKFVLLENDLPDNY